MDNPSEYIDLHTHSTASDGSDTPAGVFRLASRSGLAAVALTDHDTTDGIAEFLAAGRENPVCRAIPGVELSCRFASRELHIVGLFIESGNAALAEFLRKQRLTRSDRNEKLLTLLNRRGYAMTWEEPEFQAVPRRDNVGRPHFAAVLMRKYGFATSQEVFNKLLGRGRECYIERHYADAGEAIAAIRSACGVAVWAHPVYRNRNEAAFVRRCVKTLKRLGLEGIEGYYSLFGKPETELVTAVAEEFDLAISGGSDYHGSHSPEVSLGEGKGGLRVPKTLLDRLEEKRSLS